MFHGHRAGVEEDQDDDKPEPGRGLKDKLFREQNFKVSSLYFAAAPYQES